MRRNHKLGLLIKKYINEQHAKKQQRSKQRHSLTIYIPTKYVWLQRQQRRLQLLW